MRVLIAEDEAPARARLAALLHDLAPAYRIAGDATNGHEVLAFCANEPVDLVLLDIRMPGMDGIEAALALAERPDPPAVVFVTAYNEHALAAFEANAIDYLLKPVRPERLRRALEKAAALTGDQQRALGADVAYISTSYRGGVVRVRAAEVSVLRADSKYVEVWHPGGVSLTEESLRALEQRLPGRFLRVHRNALVAPARIHALRREGDGRLLLEVDGCNEAIEVSRRHAPSVRALLRRHG